MQDVKDVAKFVFRYPACMFWVSFFIVPTILISSPVAYLFIKQEIKFSPISSLLTKSSTKDMTWVGLFLGLVSLISNHITCHKFYSKLNRGKKANDKASQFLSLFVRFIDISMISIDVSLAIIIFVSIKTLQVIHIITTLIFIISSIIFSFGIDIIMKKQNKSIPLSNSLNLVLLVTSIISGILFAFSKDHRTILSIASLLEDVSFVLIFFKYIFVAMNVLGGNFLPKRLFSLETPTSDYSLNDEYLP